MAVKAYDSFYLFKEFVNNIVDVVRLLNTRQSSENIGNLWSRIIRLFDYVYL